MNSRFESGNDSSLDVFIQGSHLALVRSQRSIALYGDSKAVNKQTPPDLDVVRELDISAI